MPTNPNNKTQLCDSIIRKLSLHKGASERTKANTPAFVVFDFSFALPYRTAKGANVNKTIYAHLSELFLFEALLHSNLSNN